MTRPSQNTDEKLVKAAIALIPQTGFSGLSMRAVARRAGVNLGMFHYHFKNKGEFLKRVADEFYEEFYREFAQEAAAGRDPKERLYNAIFNFARFVRTNRKLLLALGRDILEGDQQIVRFLEELVPRHAVIILDLVRQCQKQKLIADLPLPLVITFMLSSLAGPSILMALLEQTKIKQPYDFIKHALIPLMLKDTILEQRLNLAFRALAPGTTVEPLPPGVDRKINTLIDLALKRTLASPKAAPKNRRQS